MIKHWQTMQEYLCFLNDSIRGWPRLPFLYVVERLKSDRVLASLIGCTTDSLPPVGSYFDFMDRLWAAPASDLYSRSKLLPSSWNSRKPEKPKGKKQKALEPKPKITETIAKRLVDGKDIPFHFEQRLQLLFYHATVLPSMECGLIPEEHLTVSGDVTAVHTHACSRGHHRDGVPENMRHFSDPDASWGWDSDLDKYYFGYTLFQLSCYNAQLKSDIPLLLRFTSARRHDSVSFLVAFHELEKYMPALSAENVCLDSAMDNYPTYRLLKNRKIRAFIDLNNKCGRPKTIPDTITIDKDGTPLCQANLRMVPNGCDRSAGYLMWRCPFGKDSKCKNSCTSSKYGRVIKTRPEWDIRLYTEIPRGTDAYKKSITNARQRSGSITDTQ